MHHTHLDVPPKFTEGPKNETFYQLYGTSVTIPCKASGVPTPKVTWMKGGVAMVAGQWSDKVTVTDDGSTLKFTEVTKKESGEYKCVASNLATTVWSTASVKVYCKIFEYSNFSLEIYLLCILAG